MCDEREPLLAYLYDEADPIERRRVEAHLETCETCREELNGLQRVRQDLLAWDVPNHESVWKPFVPARQLWSWRDVPAWTMAAAAGLMLALGAAGGAAAHTWLTRPATVAQASHTTMPQLVNTQPMAPLTMMSAKAVPASTAPLTQADLDRIVQRLVAEMDRRDQAATVRAGADHDLLEAAIKDYNRLLVAKGRTDDKVKALEDAFNGFLQSQSGGR